ncbi:hypothetical protein Ahy_A06g027361 [Arachis hypogaea]|uniref:Uncharacterized protein n=1 Tax=Arachis hypogaea TaxID=3818 RepID=A0A445CND2_ARAHY|nr:hypothetical protein Ahy_A06g027361 [Arachis hypogaea]
MKTIEVGSANDGDDSLDQEIGTEKCQCGGCNIFPTSEVAYDMYVTYAKCVGFGVRKGDFVKTKDGCYSRRKFFCNKAKLREKKYYDNVSRKREQKAETRINCQAKLCLYVDKSANVWRVKNLFDEHNHDLVPQCMIHLIPNHLQITDANKAQANIMHMYGVPTSQIMGFMARQDKLVGGNANATISYLFGKADVDPMAMARYSSTTEDRQTCIFGFAILDNEMASTYKWLLANFLEVMMNKHPKVAVTDADEAMKEAINEIFPNTTHSCADGIFKKCYFENQRPRLM